MSTMNNNDTQSSNSNNTNTLRTMRIICFLYCLALLEMASAFHLARSSRTGASVRLAYKNDASSSESKSSSSWWSSFTPSASTKSKTAEAAAPSQQEQVDDYLLFLEKRYKRVHREEQRHLKHEAKRQENAQPFSAMEWLMSSATTTPTASQNEDALYALGVAGLASERLLQKHHHQLPKEALASPSSSTDDDESVIEVTAVQASDDEDGALSDGPPSKRSPTDVAVPPNHFFIKKVLVPIIRAVYIVQRRREMAVHRIQSAIASMASKSLQTFTRPVALRLRKGPKGVIDALLDIGGGKRNVVMTLACAYTAVLILRPMLQAAVAEASVGP